MELFYRHDDADKAAAQKNTGFSWKANGKRPTDNKKWAELVTHLLLHCEERYGREELRQSYFEVWNEPNLRFFFKTVTEAQYFELYPRDGRDREVHRPIVARGRPSQQQLSSRP